MPALPGEPKRNRVTPLGNIIATPLRGAWTGNRGILHRGSKIVRFHRGPLWITCALRHKDWELPQWAPNHYTVLFFHDEAVALAAGHRPCALCRPEAYESFRTAVADGVSAQVLSAKELDRTLHAERLFPGTHVRRMHTMDWVDLPTGAFVVHHNTPSLVIDDAVLPWTRNGYAGPRFRPKRGAVKVITPPSTLAALRAGYRPQLDAMVPQQRPLVMPAR